MGAGNAKRVYANWGSLHHVPFRVLTFMALTSLDSDNPPRYFGGNDALAEAIGRVLPTKEEADDDPKAMKERKAALEAVRVATKALTKAGAVSLLSKAYLGHNQEWALILGPAVMPQVHPGPLKASMPQAHPGSYEGHAPGSAWSESRLSLPMTQGEPGPKEYEEYSGVLPPPPQSDSAASSVANAENGGGEIEREKDDLEALVDEVLVIRPEWRREKIRAALDAPAVRERPRRLWRAAFLAVAKDPATQYPSRFPKDGPWWSAAVPRQGRRTTDLNSADVVELAARRAEAQRTVDASSHAAAVRAQLKSAKQ